MTSKTKVPKVSHPSRVFRKCQRRSPKLATKLRPQANVADPVAQDRQDAGDRVDRVDREDRADRKVLVAAEVQVVAGPAWLADRTVQAVEAAEAVHLVVPVMLVRVSDVAEHDQSRHQESLAAQTA